MMEEYRDVELETRELQVAFSEAQLQLSQLREEKGQIQKCYDQAIQEVADSEAKREIAEKELRLAHDQISNMWQELDSLRKIVDSPAAAPAPSKLTKQLTSPTPVPTQGSMTVLCTLCQEKVDLNQIPPHHPNGKLTNGCPPTVQDSSPKQSKQRKSSWLFGSKKQPRVQELDSHSRTCSTSSTSPSRLNPHSPSRTRYANSCSPSSSPSARRKVIKAGGSPSKTADKRAGQGEEFLVVNVTRSSHGITDMSPFKIVTKTNFLCFPSTSMEVFRSQGDFLWLYSALQEACPERIVPPLRPPISLDATISEFQRFLSRLSTHRVLSAHHFFVVFLSGTAEELRGLRAKHRPRRHSDKAQFKPAVGRDTNSGPLVDTKDYLTMLEQNLIGLTSHLEHGTRRGRGSPMERSAHWFSAISDSEPHHTYLKRASADLARTCEAMENHMGDSDEMLFIQNLQSLADYIRVAQDLLTRVEEAVDQYLYWDEEVTIIEAVNSSPKAEHSPPPHYGSTGGELQDTTNDDSGVSDVNSSSTGEGSHTRSDSQGTLGEEDRSRDLTDSDSSSERWAHVSKKCADAKDYLEMMCDGLAEELSFFDLQKEKEVKQILLDYATSQLERHEKFQGKWFAMKFILDSPILAEKRAIQFSPAVSVTPSSPTLQ